MTLAKPKLLAGIFSAVCTALYAVLLTSPPSMSPDGTLEAEGSGRAIEIVVILGASYLLALFLINAWARRNRTTKDEFPE